MSGPIDVTITTDVDGVVKGAEKVADSFDEIDDALKDTAKSGDQAFDSLGEDAEAAAKAIKKDLNRSLEDVEDSLKETGKAGDKAFESVEDDAQAAAKVIDRDLTQAITEAEKKLDSTGKSGKNLGDGIEAGSGRARGALNDLRDEANSTASEAAASFDGSAGSISDAFQEVAANMGPVGLALAVTMGIGIAKMQELAEANDEASQASIDLAKEIYNVGGAMDKADLAAKIEEWAFSLGSEDNWLTPWADESISNIERVKDFAGDNKDLAKTIFESFEGDPEKAAAGFDKLTEAIDRDTQALKDHVSYYDNNGQAVYDEQGEAIRKRIETGRGLQKSLEEEKEKSGDATASNEYYTDVMGESEAAVDKRKEAEDELLQVQQDRIDAEKELAENNRTAVETEIEYNQTLEDTSKGLRERGKNTDNLTKSGQENNLALLNLTETGTDYLQGLYDQGEGADSLADKVARVRQNFIDQAVAAGYSAEEAAKLAEEYGLVPPEVLTKIKSEGGPEAKAAVQDAATDESATVNVDTQGVPETQGEIAAVQGKEVKVDVDDMYTVKEVQNRIDGIRGRDEVKIDVDDVYTVREVQNRIDGIDGRDVDINVRLTNLQAVKNELAFLTMTRTAYVDIVQRRGQEAP